MNSNSFIFNVLANIYILTTIILSGTMIYFGIETNNILLLLPLPLLFIFCSVIFLGLVAYKLDCKKSGALKE